VWSDDESPEPLLEQPLAVEDLDVWIEAFTRIADDPPQPRGSSPLDGEDSGAQVGTHIP